MQENLEDKDWNTLLRRIKAGKCTPFIGAGACHPVLPLGSDIALEWAEEYNYPLEDCNDLVRVAQFLAVDRDHMFPKEIIRDKFKDRLREISQQHFEAPEPHGVLADLPLPVYITTNYDDLMVKALRDRDKEPRRELCRWNKYVKQYTHSDSDFSSTPEKPIVFHLHGFYETPESLVLTEDDYLDFLVNISREKDILPPRIQEAFAGSSLLFIGYGITDWDFRVLFRSLVRYLERSIGRGHVSVQLVPGGSDAQKTKAKEYLDNYFGELKITVYWGDCREFTNELKRRWEDFNGGN